MTKIPEIKMVGDGKGIFIFVGGVKIAERGRPGTAHAKRWISLEPGWTVRDVRGGKAIEIECDGVRVH